MANYSQKVCFCKSKLPPILGLIYIYILLILIIVVWSIFPGPTKEIKTEDGESGTLTLTVMAGVWSIIAAILVSFLLCIDTNIEVICKRVLFVFTILTLIPAFSTSLVSLITFSDEQGIDTSLPKIHFSIVVMTVNCFTQLMVGILLLISGCCLNNSFFCYRSKNNSIHESRQNRNLQMQVQNLQRQVQMLQGGGAVAGQNFYYGQVGVPAAAIPQNNSYIPPPNFIPPPPQSGINYPAINPQGQQFYNQQPYVAAPVVIQQQQDLQKMNDFNPTKTNQ